MVREIANHHHLAMQWNRRSLMGSTFSLFLDFLLASAYRVKNVINVRTNDTAENQNDVERMVLLLML